jgi:hypothetical protein
MAIVHALLLFGLAYALAIYLLAGDLQACPSMFLQLAKRQQTMT